jgi:ABC-2 type transport system ATP-binding protein
MTTAIRAGNLGKSYGGKPALREVSFDLMPGQWCTLLGENGAGKSTLIQLLCGLFTPDEGRVEIAGHDLATSPTRALAHLGVVFQQSTLDLDLSVRDNLLYHAGLHGLPHAQAVQRLAQGLAWMGLQAHEKHKVRSLSGGNRRKVELVRSLLHGPRVLLMDEATVGLDPASREHLLQGVHQLVREQQMCVIWTTHWAQEARHSDVLLVLQKGRLGFQGKPESLVQQTGQRDLENAFLSFTQATPKPAA